MTFRPTDYRVPPSAGSDVKNKRKILDLGAGRVSTAPELQGSCVQVKDQCYPLMPNQIKNRIDPRSALEGHNSSTHVGEACQWLLNQCMLLSQAAVVT